MNRNVGAFCRLESDGFSDGNMSQFARGDSPGDSKNENGVRMTREDLGIEETHDHMTVSLDHMFSNHNVHMLFS